MKKYALLIIVVFLCFTMCNKEDSVENYCYSTSLLSQINSGDLAIYGLTYNSNCLIFESTEPFIYRKFSYDAQNLAIKVERAHSFSAFSCAMLPGQSFETDPRKAQITEYSNFEYDQSLRLVKKSNYFNGDGTWRLYSYHTYDYLDFQISKMNT